MVLVYAENGKDVDMPIYNYICTKCRKQQERLYRGETLKCIHCGGELIQKPTYDGISVRYVGAGWAGKS